MTEPDQGLKKLIILGSTGSIGRQTLEVVQRYPERYRVLGLAARDETDILLEQVNKFGPAWVGVFSARAGQEMKQKLPAGVHLLSGMDGLCELAALPQADMVVVALSGSVGIQPTLAAIRAGKDIALANKETLVAAGDIVMEAVRRSGVNLLPVDSEHSAIFQCRAGEEKHVKHLWLTASGGPFRDFSPEQLINITPELALHHPVWKMGPKITIDSATLMNKGLEVIEAHHLFATEYERIRVVVHRESIVHSMVELVDGSFLAHMGVADMRIPIQLALSYPERLDSPGDPLDFPSLGSMHFEPVDTIRFPALDLAYQAGAAGGTMPAVMNAANEVAVELFLQGKIGFTMIAALVERVMARHAPIQGPDLEVILEADAWARQQCLELSTNIHH
jgi:1-deoxy-D-xylulose-5-phosphate reductoisomerase